MRARTAFLAIVVPGLLGLTAPAGGRPAIPTARPLAATALAPIPRRLVAPPNHVPWPSLHHDATRAGRSEESGPDDPSLLRTPWPYDPGAKVQTSPAIDTDGTAYLGASDGTLHAVTAGGVKKWIFNAGGAIDSSPTILRSPEGYPGVYAGADDGFVYAVDPNGSPRWQVPLPGGAEINTSPAVVPLGTTALARVYVTSDDGTLTAIFETTRTSAQVVWQATIAPGPVGTSPAVDVGSDVVYATADGALHCFDAWTGAPVGGSPVKIGSAPLTTPVFDPASSTVYVGDGNGDLHSVPSDCTSTATWSVNVGDPIVDAPAITPDGDLVVAAGLFVSAVSATGQLLWSEKLASPIDTAPIVDAAATSYVGTTDGWIFAVTAASHPSGSRLLWGVQVDPNAPALTAPALDYGGRVYVAAETGPLNVIDETPAFQIAYHSDVYDPSNLDVYSLRETYGTVDPGRTLRLTVPPSAELEPAYSVDQHEMAFASDRAGSKDAFLANGMAGAASDVSLARPNAPFTPVSVESDPATTPIDDRTGLSRLPDGQRYVAMTTDASGTDQIVFVDSTVHRAGGTRVSTLTQWALDQGVPGGLAAQLESPPKTAQSQVAFAPNGEAAAWMDCRIADHYGVIKLLLLDGANSALLEIGPRFVAEGSADCRDRSPAFAPDSRWIAIRQGNDLAVYALDGTPSVLSPAPANTAYTHPAWSPDGSEIAVGAQVGATVDLSVLTGAGYAHAGPLTATTTSDQPYYRYGKMPAPQAVKLGGGAAGYPDRQYPGATIDILGRGFDLRHPTENEVTFTDTLRGARQPATVVDAFVDPAEGLGVLRVLVPAMAGNGTVSVTTAFGTTDCCSFIVLPKPDEIRQTRFVAGQKIRVFGLGFDLTPATGNEVLFDGPSGPVKGTVLSGALDGAREVLTVVVPAGTKASGTVTVNSTTGLLGSSCCSWSLLSPTLLVERQNNDGAGLGEVPGNYRFQGTSGEHVLVSASNFPYDPFFGYGATLDVRIAPWNVQMLNSSGGNFALVQTSADTAGTAASYDAIIPARPSTTFDRVASITFEGRDASFTPGLPAIATSTFTVPLLNVPIIFVPGTSGNSLDLPPSTSLSMSLPTDTHYFPWICTACPQGLEVHPPQTITVNPASSPDETRGPRVWIGPEMATHVTSPVGWLNHYLDALAFNSLGAPVFPAIAPGTVLRNVSNPSWAVPLKGKETAVYEPLIAFLTGTTDPSGGTPPSGNLGRPLCSLTACSSGNLADQARGVYLFPYEWRGDMSTNVTLLDSFVNSVLNLPSVKAAGITKVDLITHSQGGPTTRAWYLMNQGKANQVIHFAGGFLGVGLPVKILVMGDRWLDFPAAGGYGSVAWGFRDWEVKDVSQNWGTAYFQAPNSQDWFFDDGQTTPSGGKIDRSYIQDRRLLGAGDLHSYSASQNFLSSEHNGTLASRAASFFTSLPRGLGDFRGGTAGLFEYRVIEHGVRTVSGARLYSAPSDWGLLQLRIAGACNPVECVPRTKHSPIYADGDNTVTYHGALGLTDANDDRVFVVEESQAPGLVHSDVPNHSESLKLLAGILGGTIGSQSQQTFFVSHASAAEEFRPVASGSRANLAGADRWHVEVIGAAQLDVTDGAGNHVGPGGDSEHPGMFDVEIPGADFDPGTTVGELGNSYSSLFLTEPGTYSLVLTGVSDTAADLRVTALGPDGPVGSVFFSGLPLAQGGTATFVFSTDDPPDAPVATVSNPDGPPQDVAGWVLDPVAALDGSPPVTDAQTNTSAHTVTVTATDEGGSGLLRTWVTFDGEHFTQYSGSPMPVPGDAKIIMAFSEDRNGNVEYPGDTIGVLGGSPKRVTFRATAGQGTLPSRDVSITNLDPYGITGALSWQATETLPWLSVSPGTGSTPGTLTLTATAEGLAPGTYRGKVTIKNLTPGAYPAKITITVTLIVKG